MATHRAATDARLAPGSWNGGGQRPGDARPSPRRNDVAESWPSVWGRRALVWPLFLAAAMLLWSALPVWLLLALTADSLGEGIGRRPWTRTVTMLAVYFGCEVLGVLAAGAIFLLTLPADENTRLRANAALQRVWSGALLTALRRVFAMTFVVEGREHATPGPMLVLVRHSSTADTLLAAALVANPHRLILRYVLKRELLWDPCLDVVGRRLPNVFVDRSGESGTEQLDRIASLARGLDEHSGVLIYPEGTRFSERRRVAALERVVASGRSELARVAQDFTHVLPPRLGGPLRLLEEMRGVDVVFLEHYGLEGARSFAALTRGALVGATIRVRLRRVKGDQVPRDRLDLWLFQQWRETNAWVATHQVGSGP